MKVLRTAIAVAALVFMLCSPSTAAITEPIITATVADTGTMTLLIEGFNLPSGAVYMGQPGGGAQKLSIINASSTTIEAQLRSAEPGTYIVAIALSADQFWTGYVTVGAVGPQGPQGDTGPQGSPGLSGFVRIESIDVFTLAPLSTGKYFASCSTLPGTKVISGGFIGGTDSDEFFVLKASAPQTDTGWRVIVDNIDTVSHPVSLYIICANVAP